MEISVIMPALNEEGCIRRTLECLRKQTFDDFEIIVVDGNSKDETRDIAKEYTKKVFVLKKKGCPVARNYGVKKAKGRIVAHTDADCIIPPTWLEKIHEDFRKFDVDMVWGPVYFTDEVSIAIKMHVILLWNLQKITWKFAPYTMNPNVAFTKKGFNEIGGYRLDLRYLDDYDIGRRGIKKLDAHYNPNNVVIFSARRYSNTMDILFDLKKVLKGLTEYHLTNGTSEVHIPMSEYK